MMDLDDLAKIVKDGHGETQKKIDCLDGKVEQLKMNQVAIRTELDKSIVRKEDCYHSQQGCRDAVYGRIRDTEAAIKKEILSSSKTVREYLDSFAKKNGTNGNGGIPLKIVLPLVGAIVTLSGILVYVIKSLLEAK